MSDIKILTAWCCDKHGPASYVWCYWLRVSSTGEEMLLFWNLHFAHTEGQCKYRIVA
jgi:hypothetical protein